MDGILFPDANSLDKDFTLKLLAMVDHASIQSVRKINKRNEEKIDRLMLKLFMLYNIQSTQNSLQSQPIPQSSPSHSNEPNSNCLIATSSQSTRIENTANTTNTSTRNENDNDSKSKDQTTDSVTTESTTKEATETKTEELKASKVDSKEEEIESLQTSSLQCGNVPNSAGLAVTEKKELESDVFLHSQKTNDKQHNNNNKNNNNKYQLSDDLKWRFLYIWEQCLGVTLSKTSPNVLPDKFLRTVLNEFCSYRECRDSFCLVNNRWLHLIRGDEYRPFIPFMTTREVLPLKKGSKIDFQNIDGLWTQGEIFSIRPDLQGFCTSHKYGPLTGFQTWYSKFVLHTGMSLVLPFGLVISFFLYIFLYFFFLLALFFATFFLLVFGCLLMLLSIHPLYLFVNIFD